jgi:hypothetical protein
MFERQLAGLSARFANVFGDQVRDGNRELKYLLKFLGFDRSNFVESNDTHRPGAVFPGLVSRPDSCGKNHARAIDR